MKLDVWLEKEPSSAERLKVIASLCRALAESHQRGFALGGLAPSQVDVDNDGDVRLESGGLGGGSPYAAPELAQGGPATPKTDIYSAAAVFYEILTGKPPFQSVPPRPLQEARPDLSQDLTDAVTACMESDPEWRPADLSYLQAVVQQLQKGAPAAGKAPAPRPAAPRATGPPRTILDPAPLRRRDDRSALTRALPVILVLVAIAGTGGAWLWYDVLRPDRPSAVATARRSPSPSRTPAVGETESSHSPAPRPSGVLPLPIPTPGVAGSSPANALRTPDPAAAAAASPTPTSRASVRPSSSPSPPPTPRPAAPATVVAPAVDANPGASGAAPPSKPEAAPTTAPTEAPPVPEQGAGPPVIRAVAPFRLRAGALQVLDVHGSGLRSDHRARVVPLRKREAATGFTVTRYQLRGAGLLLVFVQVDAAVHPGKYALSLVDAGGAETNAFTIEVVSK